MIEPERLTELNDAPEQAGDYVFYWMQNSQRAEFNPALEVAIAEANRLGLPALVGFGLTPTPPKRMRAITPLCSKDLPRPSTPFASAGSVSSSVSVTPTKWR